MAVDILCLTAFVVLLLCRFVLAHNIAAPPRQKHNVFVQGQHVLGRFRMGNFENVLNSFELSDREDRAETYLRRVITLTGAKQMRNSCVLDVGKTRFHVYVASVSRLRDVTDPICTYECTCFYVADQDMPVGEKIATVLLQLKSNPALFDGWLVKRNVFKADGNVFRPAKWFGQ